MRDNRVSRQGVAWGNHVLRSSLQCRQDDVTAQGGRRRDIFRVLLPDGRSSKSVVMFLPPGSLRCQDLFDPMTRCGGTMLDKPGRRVDDRFFMGHDP